MAPSEQHHNTREQVAEYARTALEIADELGLEGDDRAALLPKMQEHLASKTIYQQAPAHLLQVPPDALGRR